MPSMETEQRGLGSPCIQQYPENVNASPTTEGGSSEEKSPGTSPENSWMSASIDRKSVPLEPIAETENPGGSPSSPSDLEVKDPVPIRSITPMSRTLAEARALKVRVSRESAVKVASRGAVLSAGCARSREVSRFGGDCSLFL